MKKIVAAFDFDKTITTHDTLLPFLYQLNPCIENLTKSATLIPTFVAYKLGLLDNYSTKEKLLVTFLKNYDYSDLIQKAEIFAEIKLPTYVKSEAIKRIRWHQSQQHHCILVSAGLEIYLKPWAEKMGFDHVLATRLHTENEKVSGKMIGLNCFGQEKVDRLLKLLGPKKNFILYAYGDSRGDKELLAMADYRFYRTLPE